MKRHTFYLVALVLGISGLLSGEQLLPESIAYQKASVGQLIPFRDGVLVKSDDFHADSVMYARFDAGETECLRINGIELLFDAQRSSGGMLFLGLSEKKLALIEETAGGVFRSIEVPEQFHPQFLEDLSPSVSPRLIATSHKVAAIAGDVVWWLGKDWKSRKLPPVPRFYEEFKPEDVGSVHYLEGTVLYAGWNRGEWGGMLVSIDVSNPDSKWIHLSGKPVEDKSGIPGNTPVQSIISPEKGHLWVATGLAHLDGEWRGLHHRDQEGNWKTLIDGKFEEDRGAMKLPLSFSIQGLGSDADGVIHVLGGSAGILRIGKEGIEQIIQHNFFNHHSKQEDYIVGCYPSALGISRTGDIYVSTNSFGVLAFRKTDAGWSARQITLNERDHKMLEAVSLPPSRFDKGDE